VELRLTADPDAVCEIRETHAALTDIAEAFGVHFNLVYARERMQRAETGAIL
jgi:hypothetical protein